MKSVLYKIPEFSIKVEIQIYTSIPAMLEYERNKSAKLMKLYYSLYGICSIKYFDWDTDVYFEDEESLTKFIMTYL